MRAVNEVEVIAVAVLVCVVASCVLAVVLSVVDIYKGRGWPW